MFTKEIGVIENLLPCKIGDTIYTIERSTYSTELERYGYEIKNHTCEGFIIDSDDNKLRIRPAFDTWDGWYAIDDRDYVDDNDGYGYFNTLDEAREKLSEIKEEQLIKAQNKWLDNL